MSGLARVAGLFAGIGGIEIGLNRAGLRAVYLNELDEHARVVLRAQFPGVPTSADIREVRRLPPVEVVTAGFPCTDISQAGRKSGIDGTQSSLVNEVFRLLADCRPAPQWLILENVSYMLRLDRGRAMDHVVAAVESLGYRWAYRVVDARSFGLPQRRQRVVFVASKQHDPRTVLYADDAEPQFDDAIGSVDERCAYGFYWTEGLRGLGWAKDAVPTIKGGSGLGIPSAPAIWYPETGDFGTPQIEDGELMQGLPPDWTRPSVLAGARPGSRWKQVGNAVCVPMSHWVGRRLKEPGNPVAGNWTIPISGPKWPTAGFGGGGKRWQAPVSSTPYPADYSLRKFLTMPVKPLSAKATAGFLERAGRSKLRFADGFLRSLEDHLTVMQDAPDHVPPRR